MAVYLILAFVVIMMPFIVQSNYWIYMFTLAGIFMILVSGLDLLYGYTGLVNLGHAAFFGIGAYSCALLELKLGFPFLPALIAGTLITAIFAALVGWPMLRIKGPYFALGTLAFGIIVSIVIHNWDSLTGGVALFGIPSLPKVNFMGFSIDFASKRVYYYLILVCLVLSMFLMHRLTHSRIGRALEAIRENDELAAAIGVNVSYYKLLSFVVASSVAAVAGGFYAKYMSAIEPAIAGSHMSFELLVMIVVGGTRTKTGVIIGPLLIWFLPEFLGAAQAYRPLFYGVILLTVIILMPAGIAGKIREINPGIAKWIP